MVGLMKLKCLVFACMIVAGPITAKAALSCGEVNRNLKPCTHYLTSGGRLGPVCCNGVRNLNGMARTPFDRRQACRCIKSAARSLGPGLNRGLAAGIPSKCGIRIPYNIQVRFSTNCNNVR